MKMKLMKNKIYLQQNFSRNVLVPETTADFTSRVSKSYVPFTCKFPMVMHFVSILPGWCRLKTDFYVFSYEKTSLKFGASFRFFLAVFMEKFQKIHYLNYVRRGIANSGYWLGVCHGWSDLHGLTRPVKSANRTKNYKMKILAHSGIRTQDLQHTKQTR